MGDEIFSYYLFSGLALCHSLSRIVFSSCPFLLEKVANIGFVSSMFFVSDNSVFLLTSAVVFPFLLYCQR